MIEVVRMEGSTFLPPPARFETGVPPVPLAAGLGAAVDYLTRLGMDNVAAHEESLTAHALDALRDIPGVRILGPTTTKDRGGTVAFEVDGVHPHDVGQVLDEPGHRDPHRPPLRVAAAPGARLPGVQPGQLSTCTTRTRRSTRWPTGSGTPSSSSGSESQWNIGSRRGVLEDTMQLESMYQEIILDHYRNPHHKGLRDPFDAQVYHVNPTCGDEVTLRVALKDVGGEPVVEDVSYDALGCSISQASASVMSDLVIGKPVARRCRSATPSSS